MTVRSRRRLAIGAGVVVFLLVSAVVARWLSADGDERAKVTDLLQAQLRGDAAAMAAELDRCDPACRAQLETLARRLKGPGEVEIVRFDSETSHSLTEDTGQTRVVWRSAGRLTTVQCVTVQRTGTVLTGPAVTLLGLSAPIGREAGC